MGNLIKMDLIRARKDVLLKVMLIVGAAFALTTPLLYSLMLGDMDAETMMVMEAMGVNQFHAKTQFFASFSLSNNCGLVATILTAILLCRDFSYGTIRNKIICGHSRTSIFISMYIMCAVVMWLVMLAQALLTLGISLLFFDYQAGAFTMTDFGYLMASLGFELLDYLFIAALITMLCAVFKKAGLAIVLYMAVMFLFSLVGVILSVVILVMGFEPGNGDSVAVLEFFQRINIFQSNAMIGTGSGYDLEDVAYYVLPPVLFTAGLLSFGAWRFNQKDLK